jgi:hypothetical protein
MSTDELPAPGAAFVRVLMPAAAPSVILALGRWWHAQGAAHSIGDAALMSILAAGALGCAIATRGAAGVPAYCVGAAGGLAAAAIAGYATGLALPLITWAVATALTAIAALRGHRAETRGEVEHARVMERERLRAQTEIQREAIRAQSRIEVASITGAWQARAAAITAATARTAYQVPPIDAGLLALSPEAELALASPTVRRALEPHRPAEPAEESDACDLTPEPAPIASAPLWRAS